MTDERPSQLPLSDRVAAISDRTELAAALRELRAGSGLTVREVVERSGGLHGTISGWFSGHHVPTKASVEMFSAVLVACGVDDESERKEWWEAVSRVRSTPGKLTSDKSKGAAPYKGLAAFTEADAQWFFGRGELTDRLCRRVQAARESGGGLLFVVGASGSGKSSLLRAGLGPAFDGVQIRSGLSDLREFLAADTAPEPGAILVFDQAEELWTLASADERRGFLESAATLLADSDAVLVIGLRADFFQNAAAEDVLLAGLSDNPIVVGRLSEEQLREVITLPASKAGVTVDDSLVQVLIGELGPRGSQFAHDSGALPLLSHALLTTWQLAGGKTLTVADYLATGGIGGAVGQSAEAVFGGLSSDQQIEARRIFLRLVNLDDEIVTRRRVDRLELFRGDEVAGAIDDVDTVIERFAGRRLVTVEEETVQVTHEALLTAWPRLREWLDADKQWLVEHRRLTHAAELWDDSNRDASALLTPTRLAHVHDSIGADRDGDLNAIERDYLDASAARRDSEIRTERRRRRILEGLVGALATLTVLAITFAATAFVARSESNTRRVDAERAESEAVSRQIAGVAQQLRAIDPALAEYFALAAYEVNGTVEARSALLDASAIHAPVRLAGVEGNAVTAVDPTGSLLATAGSDGRVRLWTFGADAMPSAGEIVTAAAGDSSVLAFDPRGSVLAVGGASGVGLWSVVDPAQPALLSEIDGAGAHTVSYTPDGQQLLVGGTGDALQRWDVSDSEQPRAVGEVVQPGGATATEFSPDGRYLVTVGAGRAMRMWDTARWDVPVLDVPSDDSTYSALQLAFSPDSRTLIAGTTGREVLRWGVDGPGRLTPLPALEGFTSYVNDVAFSPDGSRIAAASSDNSSKIWDATTGDLDSTLPGPSLVTSIVFGRDNSSVVTAGADGITRVWPLPGPVLAAGGDTIYQNPIDPTGRVLLAGHGARATGSVLWNVSNPDKPVASPPMEIDGDSQTGAVAIRADGNIAAIGTATGGFQLWNTEDPSNPTAIGPVHPALSSLAAVTTFGRSGDVLALSGQSSNEVALWAVADPGDPRELSQVDAGNYPAAMAISPDEHVLAVATVDSVVKLWDITDPQNPRATVTLDGFGSDAQAITFSPDGMTLAAGSADRSIRLWDMSDENAPSHLVRIVGPSGAIYSLNFDASGSHLAAGIGGESLWIWDVSDRAAPARYATLTAYGARVNDAVFADDGKTVFAGGSARNVRVWRTDPADVRARLCGSAGSTVTQQEWAQYLPGVAFRRLCDG